MESKLYKEIALARLKGRWLTGLWISLVYFMIFGFISSRLILDIDDPESVAMFALTNTIATIVLAPVSVGRSWAFLRISREEAARVSVLFEGFSSIRGYLRIVLAYGIAILLVNIGMLLVLPGIYFFLAYRFVPYLLHDRPDLSVFKVMAESRRMMRGEKIRLIKVYAGFILWGVVAFLSQVGIVFLTPYVETAIASFYERVRQEKTKPA